MCVCVLYNILIKYSTIIQRWEFHIVKNNMGGTSLVVQWLRLRAPNTGGPGSIPGQGTRSHMPQLRVFMPQLKTLHAATKDPTHCN